MGFHSVFLDGRKDLFCEGNDFLIGRKDLFYEGNDFLDERKDLFYEGNDFLDGRKDLFCEGNDFLDGRKDLFYEGNDFLDGRKDLFYEGNDFLNGRKDSFCEWVIKGLSKTTALYFLPPITLMTLIRLKNRSQDLVVGLFQIGGESFYHTPNQVHSGGIGSLKHFRSSKFIH